MIERTINTQEQEKEINMPTEVLKFGKWAMPYADFTNALVSEGKATNTGIPGRNSYNGYAYVIIDTKGYSGAIPISVKINGIELKYEASGNDWLVYVVGIKEDKLEDDKWCNINLSDPPVAVSNSGTAKLLYFDGTFKSSINDNSRFIPLDKINEFRYLKIFFNAGEGSVATLYSPEFVYENIEPSNQETQKPEQAGFNKKAVIIGGTIAAILGLWWWYKNRK